MAHFGVLCYQGAGHLNPLLVLSRELLSRGHRISFFLPPQFETRIRQQGFGFFPIDAPVDAPTRPNAEAPSFREVSSLRDTRAKLDSLDREIGVYIHEYLEAVTAAGVDVLLMGEITLAGPTVAEVLRIPYFVISTSIPHNLGWSAPSTFCPQGTWQQRLQSRIFEVSIFCMNGPVRRILNRHRHKAGLGPVDGIGIAFPELAHITQWPRCLETPRQELPDRLFYAGPFIDDKPRPSVEFPWHKLNGGPLVYASLGTTRKADPALYYSIASACSGLDLQLVVTLGGRRSPDLFTNLPGNPLVVVSAPQLDLIKKADIVVTHAGPNTVLETLMSGKPMLALPLALDQPAVAARLERAGVGEVLGSQHRSADEIRERLIKLRTDKGYREAAQRIQSQLQSLHGSARAASIIEEALRRKRPHRPLSEESVSVPCVNGCTRPHYREDTNRSN